MTPDKDKIAVTFGPLAKPLSEQLARYPYRHSVLRDLQHRADAISFFGRSCG